MSDDATEERISAACILPTQRTAGSPFTLTDQQELLLEFAVSYLDPAPATPCARATSAVAPSNLDWVREHLASRVDDDELLLADAQTSGGALVVGEVPGYPIIGEVVDRREATVKVR